MVTLKEILALAQQESARQHHFFIGVEHLFLALTHIQGGLASVVLARQGVSARFVRYNIRETVGRYENRRYWLGFPETPRAQSVLDVARHHIAEGIEPERALLLAILDEGDSVVTRVLTELGVDTEALRRAVLEWDAPSEPQAPDIPVHSSVELDPYQVRVLQAMFRDYGHVEVVRELSGGYGSARVLLVRPVRPDQREDPLVVVKLDDRRSILHERRHYDLHVRHILPANAAHLVDAPTVPDGTPYGGLKYSFAAPLDAEHPVSLGELALQLRADDVKRLIRGLFEAFGPAWWLRRQPYQFGVWREYEHVLPPALVIEALPHARLGATGRSLTPGNKWSRDNLVSPGELVALHHFVVQKLDAKQDILYLAAGSQPQAVSLASKVEVRGLGLKPGYVDRGEVLEELVGRVVNTREGLLWDGVSALEPPFAPDADVIPSPDPRVPNLPNPIRALSALLERQVSGYLSTVHGDMHLYNVLVGPHDEPCLVDFALVREGHVLFDWAVLEVSLLVDVVARFAPSGWEGAWQTVAALQALNRSGEVPFGDVSEEVGAALSMIQAVREVARECLYTGGLWGEYYIALILLALRTLRWQTVSQDGRRLAFLAAGLALRAVHEAGEDGQTSGYMRATD